MRAYVAMAIAVLGCLARAEAQGTFLFWNGYAPTRLYLFDGPLAGPGIWGQMLAGSISDGLLPVGESREHIGMGLVGGAAVFVSVPGVPVGDVAFVQMVAWDGNLWGSSLAGVPPDQLGRTDIVRVLMVDGFPDFPRTPEFTQPAIVPIPEPSVLALGALAGGILALCSRWGRVRRGRTRRT